MKYLLAALAAIVLAGCGQVVPNTPQPLALVPYPQTVQRHDGALTLAKSVKLVVAPDAPNAKRAAKALLSRLDLRNAPGATTRITLRLIDAPELGADGYRLTVTDNVELSANTDIGLFYAVQTLRQLLPVKPDDAYRLPHVAITDVPSYAWRGSSVDVARSFLPITYLKKHIDRMAFFKLNRLHLHLTDDQGWRIEIKKHPRLTEIGGASAVEGGRTGFYTQAELKDLVAYAKARGVIIVPEVDLPGHTQAMIAAYNKLACDDVTNLDTYSGIEVGFSKLCMTKPDVIYPFVRDVLKEVTAIFPSQYIHIGGDEIKDPGYDGFVTRAAQIVEDLGRTPIVWEEGSVAELPTDALLQLWNDDYAIADAVKQGHQLILSPCSYMYIDHANYPGQPHTATWCDKDGVPLARVYSFNPQSFPAAIGVEGALWSERVHTNATADNRLWPRLAAVAEVAWTPKSQRDYTSFTERMGSMRARLDAFGIHYYPDPDLGWQ
ncbi:MAG TPA: beta-N-acetylhexosaminidase [Oleiagrimonas sp.]|nr:beta-N-acetylhexosaminidase [Oleiagrimonas sp.]